MRYPHKGLDQQVAVPVCATPAVVTGVGVVVGAYDGYVRLYDRTLSKAYWERRLDGSIYASLVMDTHRKRVVVATTGGQVACFDLRGGLVWSVDTGLPIYATPLPLAQADILLLATFQSRLLGLRLETGERVFERQLPRPWHAAHGGTSAHRDPYASPVATEAGNAIVCCAEHVFCFTPDGTQLWCSEIGHAVKASPAGLHETAEVAICPVDGRCLFLDSSTGGLRREVSLDAKVTASPAVAGSILAVGTLRETVTGLDIRTGKVAWTSPLGAPREYTSFSVLPDGNFIATSMRGNVICLQRDDGRFLWETSQVLGLADHQPAMDITPMAGPDGSMYCGSYAGDLYHFRFQPIDEENEQ